MIKSPRIKSTLLKSVKGMGVALEKYLTTMKNYRIEDIVSGKVDMQKLSNDVADMIRKGTNIKSDPERGYKENYTVSEEDKESSSTIRKTKIGGCPSCGSRLIPSEGCTKCSNPECGFTKC